MGCDSFFSAVWVILNQATKRSVEGKKDIEASDDPHVPRWTGKCRGPTNAAVSPNVTTIHLWKKNTYVMIFVITG